MLRKRNPVFRHHNKKIASGAALSLREKKTQSTKMML
jgi:hypothetical protein